MKLILLISLIFLSACGNPEQARQEYCANLAVDIAALERCIGDIGCKHDVYDYRNTERSKLTFKEFCK